MLRKRLLRFAARVFVMSAARLQPLAAHRLVLYAA